MSRSLIICGTLLLASLLAACNAAPSTSPAGSYNPQSTQSSPNSGTAGKAGAAFCSAARRLSNAINTFDSDKSSTFDATAQSQAESLISDAKRVGSLASTVDIRTTLSQLGNAVREIVADASNGSPAGLADLESATAQYVQAKATFATLETGMC